VNRASWRLLRGAQVYEKAVLEWRTLALRLQSNGRPRVPLILIAFAGSLFSTFKIKYF
jgi:hypothetical protein